MIGRVCVIGLGQFGKSVSMQLTLMGQQVLAIDSDLRRVEDVATSVQAALCVDTSDEKALLESGVQTMSCAVVAIGGDSLEASILTTSLLKQMGVPRIVARATNALHARVLRAVGAHEIVDPEGEMGQRLARRVAFPNLFEQFALDDKNALVELSCPLDFVGKSLMQLDLRARFHVTVVAIKRVQKLMVNPRPDTPLATEDVLVLIGEEQALQRVAALT